MTLTKSDFEKLIKNLQAEQTESATLDCKEELLLDQDGDKASFIHDIAAMANNGNESYIIIGIQDKTWVEVGLPSGSWLLKPDQAQGRMNQILEKRLDPQLSIKYQVFELNDKVIGVITVSGSKAPYLIAIDEAQYGGNGTKSKPCFINRGAIYIRHGDNSIVANRQAQIISILNHINTYVSSKEDDAGLREFLTKNGYLDIESPDFGKNSFTKGLIEKRWVLQDAKNEIVPAESWVVFMFCPLDGNCKVNPNDIIGKLQTEYSSGQKDPWFQGLPRSIIETLQIARATPKGISGKWDGHRELSPGQYIQALDIYPNGIIHFASTYPLFYENKEVRFFGFVSLIGYLWQIIYLVKAIYLNAGYSGAVAVILSFIGSTNTVLADLAKGPEKIWIDVFDWRYNNDPSNINQDTNFQIRRDLHLSELDDDQIQNLIYDIAEEIGHYYNQPKPKCFTPDAEEFPVRQYLQNTNW